MFNARANSHIFGKKGPFRVIVCLITLWSFLFNIFYYEIAWAAKGVSEFTGVDSEKPGSPGLSKGNKDGSKSTISIEGVLDDEDIEAGSQESFELAVMLAKAAEKGVPLGIELRDESGNLLGRKLVTRDKSGEYKNERVRRFPDKAEVAVVTLSEDKTILACEKIGPKAKSNILRVLKDVPSLPDCPPMKFGPQGRYEVGEDGAIRMGDLPPIPVKVANTDSLVDAYGERLSANGVVAVDRGGNLYIVLKTPSPETLMHELVSYLAIAYGVDITNETLPVEVMAQLSETPTAGLSGEALAEMYRERLERERDRALALPTPREVAERRKSLAAEESLTLAAQGPEETGPPQLTGGFPIAKLQPLIDNLRPFDSSSAEYEALLDNDFEGMRKMLNQKAGKKVFSSLEGIPPKRMDTLAQYQGQKGMAIHEIVKNASDWSVGKDGQVHHRSSRHGEGAFQVLGELVELSDHVVIETRRKGRRGLRLVLWTEGNSDYRARYEFADNLPLGTRVSVQKKLDGEAQAELARVLRDKLKVHTAGTIIVNGKQINTPEEYEYAGPQRGGVVDRETSRVEITISETGYVVQDFGIGMDLKVILEDFLSPHYGEDGEFSISRSWQPDEVKRFVKPDISRTTRVEMWINGHQITSYASTDDGDERLNLAQELILDFPYGASSPNSWNRLEMDERAINAIKKIIEDITDSTADITNPFAQINSMALMIRKLLKENPKAAEILMACLKDGTQSLVEARHDAGEAVILVPNEVNVTDSPYGWAGFADERLTPLDSDLFDFSLEPLHERGLLRGADSAFCDSVREGAPGLQNVPIYVANCKLRDATGSMAVWVVVDEQPVILIDQECYEKHHEESLLWFRSLLREFGNEIETRLGKAYQKIQPPKPEEKPRKRLLDFLGRWRKPILATAAGLMLAGTATWVVPKVSHWLEQKWTQGVAPGPAEGRRAIRAERLTAMEERLDIWSEKQFLLIDKLDYRAVIEDGKLTRREIKEYTDEEKEEITRLLDDVIRKYIELQRLMLDEIEEQRRTKEKGEAEKEDWDRLAEFVRSFHGRDRFDSEFGTLREFRERIEDPNYEAFGTNYDIPREHIQALGIEMLIELYLETIGGCWTADIQREFGFNDFTIHRIFSDWMQDLRMTQQEILEEIASGNKGLLSDVLLMNEMYEQYDEESAWRRFTRLDSQFQLSRGEYTISKRYMFLRLHIYNDLSRQIEGLEILEQYTSGKVKQTGEEEHEAMKVLKELYGDIMWRKGLVTLTNQKAYEAVKDGIAEMEREFNENIAEFESRLDEFRSPIDRLFGTGWKDYFGLTVLFIEIVVIILLVRHLLTMGKKYGSSSPFEDATKKTEECGPMPEIRKRGRRKAEDDIYGRLENALLGAYNFFTPLITSYGTELDTKGQWKRARSGIRKSIRQGAQPIRKPTKVTMWGIMEAGQVLCLPNYPYGVIKDIRVYAEDASGNLRLLQDILHYESMGEHLIFDRRARYHVTYEIEHYRPDDIEMSFASRPLRDEEVRALQIHFGRELDEHLGKSESERLRAIRKFMRRKAHYARDEARALDCTHATWAESLAERTKGGKRCPVVCNTSALLNALLAGYYEIPFVYVGQIIPDREGFFGRRTVLTKARDGHSAVMLKLTDEKTGRPGWRHEDSVRNIGLKPLPPGLKMLFKLPLVLVVWTFSVLPKWTFRITLFGSALIWEGAVYYRNLRRAKRVFRILDVVSSPFLDVTGSPWRTLIYTYLKRVYFHNAGRFLRGLKTHPRVHFIHLNQKAFWDGLPKWKRLYAHLAEKFDFENKPQENEFLRSIFAIGDRSHEWKIAGLGSLQRGERLRPRWSPVYHYINIPNAPTVLSDELLQTGEALLERGLRGGTLDEVDSIMDTANMLFVSHIQNAEEIATRLFQLALYDFELAGHVSEYLCEPISGGKVLKALPAAAPDEKLSEELSRIGLLNWFYRDIPEVDEHFQGSERVWIDWLLRGSDMEYGELDTVKGLEPSDRLITDEVQGRFPDGVSLGWVIDAAQWHEQHRPPSEPVELSTVRESLLEASDGKTEPLSEVEMLGTVSAQDKTRMVMIRELIQNARDAIRNNLAKLQEKGKRAVIQLKSYLHQRGEDIFWVFSVADPVGMSRKVLFEKFFPPKATTKSVQELIVEVLQEEISHEEKRDRIVEALIQEEHQDDPEMRQAILDQVRAERGPKDTALEILKGYSNRFKKSLAAGFFGVGNYTVYADADELIVRTGLDGQVDEVWLRVDRDDPDDSKRVTGIVLLSWNSYVDTKGEYEGTVVQRLKRVKSLAEVDLEDRHVKYLSSLYVGAVSDVEIEFVDTRGRGLGIPIHDDLRELGACGEVQALESGMGIMRYTVDELLIQTTHDPVVCEYIPEWAVRWLDQNFVGFYFAPGTPSVESRTALLNPREHRHDAAVATARAIIRAYREGRVEIPGLPAYADFLRDPHPFFSHNFMNPEVAEHAERINRGEELPEEVWKSYRQNPNTYAALLTHIHAPGAGPSEESLFQEKRDISFRYTPPWIQDAFLGNTALQEAVRERGFEGIAHPLYQTDAFSREMAVRLYQCAVSAYMRGEMDIPGISMNFDEYLDSPEPAVPAAENIPSDVALIREGKASEVDLDPYLEDPAMLASLLLYLPLQDGRSISEMREEWIRTQEEREAEAAEAPSEQAPSAAAILGEGVRIDQSEFAIIEAFDDFLDTTLRTLAGNLTQNERNRLFPKSVVRLALRRGGLDMFQTFREFREGNPQGDTLFDEFFSQVASDTPGARIPIYDALLRGETTVSDLRGPGTTEDINASLMDLEQMVRQGEGANFYERSLNLLQVGGTMGRWDCESKTFDPRTGLLTLHNATRIPKRGRKPEEEFLINGENEPRTITLQTRELTSEELEKIAGIPETVGMRAPPRVIVRDDSAIHHRIYGIAAEGIPFVREDVIAEGNHNQIREAFDHENRELYGEDHDDIRRAQYQGDLRSLITKLSKRDKRGKRKIDAVKKEWERARKIADEKGVELHVSLGNFYHSEVRELDLHPLSEGYLAGLYDGTTLASFELPPRAVREFGDTTQDSVVAKNPFWRKFLTVTDTVSSLKARYGVDASSELRYAMHRLMLFFAGYGFDQGEEEKVKCCLSGSNIDLKDLGAVDLEGEITETHFLQKLPEKYQSDLQKKKIVWIEKGDNPFAEKGMVVYYPPHPSFEDLLNRIKARYSSDLERMGIMPEHQNEFLVLFYFVRILVPLRDVTQAQMMADHTYRFLNSMGSSDRPDSSVIRLVHAGGATHYRTLHDLLEGSGVFDGTTLRIADPIDDPRLSIPDVFKGSTFFSNRILNILNHTEVVHGDVLIDSAYFADLFGEFLSAEGLACAVAGLQEQSVSDAAEGKFQAAEETSRAALRLDNNNSATWVHLANALAIQGKYVDAVSAYRSALELDANDPLTWRWLAEAYVELEDLDNAEQAVHRSLALYEESPRTHMMLGWIQVNQGKFSEGEATCRKALEYDKHDPLVWRGLGMILAQQEKYPEAEQAFRKSLELDDEYLQTWTNLAETLQKQEKYQEAEQAFRKAVEIDSKNSSIWAHLGYTLLKQEKYPEAEQVFRKAIEIDSRNSSVWTHLGYPLLRQKKYQEAEQALRKAVEIDSRNSSAWAYLGYALLRQERYQEAEQALRKSLELDDKDPTKWSYLGDALMPQNKCSEVEEIFYQALRRDPEMDEAWEGLEGALFEQGKSEEARRARNRDLSLLPTPSPPEISSEQDDRPPEEDTEESGTMGRWNYKSKTFDPRTGLLTLHNATRILKKGPDGRKIPEPEFGTEPRNIVLQTREMNAKERELADRLEGKLEDIRFKHRPYRVIIRDEEAIKHRIYGVAAENTPFIREDIFEEGNEDQIAEALDHERRELIRGSKHAAIRKEQYKGGLRSLVTKLSERDKREKRPSRIEPMDSGYIRETIHRLFEILFTMTLHMPAPSTVGVVVKAEPGKLQEAIQFKKELEQDGRRLNGLIRRKRSIEPDEESHIRYIVCIDDGTVNQDNIARLEEFRSKLEGVKEANNKETVFAFVLQDDKRERLKDSRIAEESERYVKYRGILDSLRASGIHMVSIKGNYLPGWWQLLAGPLFTNFIYSKQNEITRTDDKRINSLIEAIVRTVSVMTRIGYAEVKRTLGKELEAVEVEKLDDLFDGHVTLNIPPLTTLDAAREARDLRRIEREAGRAL